MTARERIIDAAIELFNAQGTAAVSTNHIAAACGVSPGNLYYHFRNKEEIIRAICERLFARWNQGYALPDDRAPTLDDLRGLVREGFALLWEYRFVYRELIALLRRDEALRARWLAVRERGFAGFRELVDGFVAAGVLRGLDDPATIGRVAELCWLISEFWPASVEVGGGEVDAAALERGIALMFQVLEPFIAPPARVG